MTPLQIERKHNSLGKAAQDAQNRYSRARGRRRDKGGRIESAAETKARSNANSRATALREFEREHGLESFQIDY